MPQRAQAYVLIGDSARAETENAGLRERAPAAAGRGKGSR